MRRIPFLLLISGLLIGSFSFGQNYVPNPGFENNTGIPTFITQWQLCTNWNNCGSGSSPDYVHTQGGGGAKLPNTQFGTVPTQQGNAAMGMCPWLPSFANYREYMSTQLTTALTAGNTYKVEFKVTSGTSGAGWSISNFSMAFSTKQLNQLGFGPINFSPQWTHSGQLQAANWKQISFYFTADSNYTHIAVGNFNSDLNTQSAAWRAGSPWSYYFIDDFSIVEDQGFYVDGDSVVCFGDSVHLWGVNDSMIGWAEINNPTVLIEKDSTLDTVLFQTTTFLAYAKSDTDTVTVKVIQYPVVNLGPDTTVCWDQGLILTPAAGNYTYLWNNGSTNPTFPVPPNVNGTYSVNVTQNICGVSDTIVITYAPKPLVDLGPDTSLCFGDSLLLNASYQNSTYIWHDGSTDSTYMAKQAGLYWVAVTDSMCSDTDSVTINFHPGLFTTLGPDTTICPGDSVTLSGGFGFSSYLWSDNSVDSTLTVSAAGQYWLQVGNGACAFADTINVFHYNPTPINLGADTHLCPFQTLLLDAGSGNSGFVWQDNSNNQTYLVNSPGIYHVTAFTGQCTVTDSIYVNYYPDLTPNLGPDTSICPGDLITFDAGPMGVSYLWSNSSTSQTITVGTAGVYTVTKIGPGNCTFTDQITLTVNPQPVVNLGPDSLLCQGQKLVLNAGNGGSTYQWQDNTTAQLYTVSQAGLYWVIVTNVHGCQDADSVNITYKTLLTDLGPDFNMCEGETIELNAAEAGATYEWQDGFTGSTYSVSAPGTYEVTVTVGYCSKSDAVNATMTYLPTTDLGPDTILCKGETLILDAGSNADTYSWNMVPVTQQVEVNYTGTYEVEVTNECGIDHDTINVEFENCGCDVYMPNAFTPNGDNMNDVIKPVISCDILDYSFQVFDRWGNLVFSTTDINQGWDGIFNGAPATEGVFVYRIDYVGQSKRGETTEDTVSGSFTLIR